MILQTEAIVLKTFDFRETSRIAHFYTRDHGKVSGVMKGIRKEPKKFGSSVERFSVNDIVYYQYRRSDLHLISQCDLKNFFFPIRQELPKSLAAYYILELVSVMLPPEEKNVSVYDLMLDFLNTLEQSADIHTLVHFFQIKILLYSGFKPHLDTCVKCRRIVRQQARFSPNEGGLVCRDCHTPDSNIHLISQGTVASILHVEKSPWTQCLRLKLTPRVREELKYTLNNFLVFHLGRRLKSARYL